MKLVRYGNAGQEKPGLIDAEGALRDLSQHVEDITGRAFAAGLMDRLRAIDPASLPVLDGDVRTVWASGLNYNDHAEETHAPIPREPIIFN